MASRTKDNFSVKFLPGYGISTHRPPGNGYILCPPDSRTHYLPAFRSPRLRTTCNFDSANCASFFALPHTKYMLVLLLLSSHSKPSRSLFQCLLLSQPLRTNPTLDSANFHKTAGFNHFWRVLFWIASCRRMHGSIRRMWSSGCFGARRNFFPKLAMKANNSQPALQTPRSTATSSKQVYFANLWLPVRGRLQEVINRGWDRCLSRGSESRSLHHCGTADDIHRCS